MKKLILLLLFLSLSGCKEKTSTIPTFNIPTNLKETAKFIKTVDGDTLKIVYDNVTQNIRLIGIDTPESKINAKAKKDAAKLHIPVEKLVAQGVVASVYTSSLIPSKSTLYVEFDKQKTDQYKRLLGYVYVNDKMLNSTIINDGYAKPMTIKPNTKYSKDFTAMYKQAVKDKKGLWK